MPKPLPPNLSDINNEICQYAKDYGLDFFDTIFEVLNYDEVNMVAAYGGFPNRYPHWRFGMEYEQLSKGFIYGSQKIYEMVINNDPCYAYLLESNSYVDQKTVMAHVYAHCDFFKNNLFFTHTNRRMIDEMANHATRIRRYVDRYGIEEVEDFIDTCLALDNLIDPHSTFIQRKPKQNITPDSDLNELGISKLKSKDYMDEYINPKSFLKKQKKMIKEEQEKSLRFPEQAQQDVMLFLIDNAPLKRWQQDVISIIRKEAYYFAPQGQTKIMNEGWAVYWHSKIMTEKACDASEIIDYVDSYAGVVSTSGGQLNPYKIGVELFRHIEERWNKGQFGKQWRECDNLDEKVRWDKQLGLGRNKIFEIRKLYNDVTFIDEFLTEEFCMKYKLFTFAYNNRKQQYEIASREFQKIKQQLLFSLTNFGQPIIYIKDGNFENRGELLLHHRFEGAELRVDWARDVLVKLYDVWKRPCWIETLIDDKGRLIGFDGSNHIEKSCTFEPMDG